MEHVLAKTFEWSKVHRNVVQAAFGWSLLFYSSHFSNVAMLGHSLASAGLPVCSYIFACVHVYVFNVCMLYIYV